MNANNKFSANRLIVCCTLACTLLLGASPASAWWGDAYRTPTSFSGGWATATDCGTYWYIYGRYSSCAEISYRAVNFIPGFVWNGHGNIKMDWVYVGAYGYLGQRLHYFNQANGLSGATTDVNMCAHGCSWARVLDGNTNNMYDWNGIHINAAISWDVGCGSPCGVRATSAREIHMWGDKWVYLNDWTVFGGYGSGSVSDTSNRSFPWGEAGLYAYPAIDTSRGTYVRDTLFGSPRTPFRVNTGDMGYAGNTNRLDFKGNASNGNNNNCDYCDAYAFAWVYTNGGAGPQLGVGADDGHRIWFNGTLVSDNNAYTGGWDSYNPGAKGLSSGWNRVLYKVHNGGGGFNGTLSFHHGTDWAQMEPSVTLQGDRYGGFSVGYEQDSWYPRIDVSTFEGATNPQPDVDVYTNDTTINASGTASVTGPVPLWTVLQYQWGYGISGSTNDAQVSSPGSSWSHQETGVTGHRRFHFFAVSRSGRLSLQPNGLSGGGNNWADGGPGNYMDIFVDNLTPNNPSFSSDPSANSSTRIDLTWTIPLDRGVNIADGSTEDANAGGTYPTNSNHYRRGDVGVQVYRAQPSPQTVVSAWSASATGKYDINLTPNTQYTYTLEARDNTSQYRGAWANTTGEKDSRSRYTLAAAPTENGNLTCDKTKATWYGLDSGLNPIGTGFTFSNPAGFGAGTHGGNTYRVNKFKWVWDQIGTHTWDGNEADWNSGNQVLTPTLGDGSYYLHLQSWNEEGVAWGTLNYGPFQYDGTRPTVSIGSPSRSAANVNTPVTYTVTFSELVSGLTVAGITLNQTGTANANLTVTPNTAEPSRYWTVTLSNCTGEGTLGIKVNAEVAVDRAGNSNTASTDSTTFFVDNTRPTCSIKRETPTSSSTNATSVQFLIVFDNPVTGFTTSDINLTKDPGIFTGDLGELLGSGNTYHIWVSNIAGTGYVSIDFAANAAQDLASNLTLAPDPVENYYIDQGAFSCSITRTGTNPTSASTVGYRLEFNKTPAAFGEGHITVGGSITGTSLANLTVTGDPKVYTVDLTNISGTGTVSISIPADTVYDYPGNGNTAVSPVVYTIDQGAITGTITRTSANPTSATTVGYQIDLNKAPVDFDISDLQLGGTVGGTSLANFTSLGLVEGNYRFTVNVVNINDSGTVSLSLPASRIHDIADNTNNEIAAVNYTIDQTPPTISSINRHTPSGQSTNASQVIYRVTFSESVTDVSTADFTLVDVNSSIAGESIVSVSASSGSIIDVTCNTGTSGNGDLRLDVVIPGATISDARGNPMQTGFGTGQVYTLDRSAPMIESIVRLNPAGQNTNAAQVTWRVSFSKSVQGVDTADFTLKDVNNTLTGETLTQVSAANGQVIDVTANTGTGNGQLKIEVTAPPATISDAVGNTLTASFTTGQVYTLDRDALTCTINRTSPNPNNAVSVGYQVVFSKSVGDFTLDDVTLGGTVPNTLLSNFAGSGNTYTFNVTNILTSGTVSVELAGSVAQDVYGNPNTGCGPVAYTIDQEGLFCSISRLSPNPTAAATVRFQINFNKSVTDFVIGDITLGGLSGTSLASFSGSGDTYTVDVINIPLNQSGEVSIELAGGVAHDSASNPNSGCGPIAYTIDHTGPSCTINRTSNNPNGAQTVGYRIVFGESVNDFTVGDLTLGGSIAGTQLADFAGSGTTYTVNVVNIHGNGTVSLAVAAGVAHDALNNPNTAGDAVEYTIDQDALTVTVNQAAGQDDPTPWLPIVFDVVFNKSVTGFAVGDVVFTGTASGISYAIQGSGASYTIQVNGVSSPGTVRPTLPEDVARDAALNGNAASTSTDNTVTYAPSANPSITQWRSVRQHGAQTLGILLVPGQVTTESRRDGLQRIEVDFDQAVQPTDGSLDVNDVSIQDAQSNSYTPTTVQLVNNGLGLVIQCSPGLLPEQKVYTIDLGSHFRGNQPPYPDMIGTRSCQVRVLSADVGGSAAGGDGEVNLIDVGAIKTRNRQPVTADNCQYDLNVDGQINLIDAAMAKLNM